MPLVLIWLVLVVVGLLASVMLMVFVLACLLYGRGRERAWLALTTALLAGLLVLLVGGSLVLANMGLFWRNWVKAVLGLGSVVVFLWMIDLALKMAESAPDKWNRGQSMLRFCAALAVLGLLSFGGLNLIFGAWRDRVQEWNGQKVVVEVTGIFRETYYRYVNRFVHGEKVYEWSD